MLTIPTRMGSEDFADYSVKKPSVFFNLGTGDPQSGVRTLIHNSDFVINEEAMVNGANVFVQFVLDVSKE